MQLLLMARRLRLRNPCRQLDVTAGQSSITKVDTSGRDDASSCNSLSLLLLLTNTLAILLRRRVAQNWLL